MAFRRHASSFLADRRPYCADDVADIEGREAYCLLACRCREFPGTILLGSWLTTPFAFAAIIFFQSLDGAA